MGGSNIFSSFVLGLSLSLALLQKWLHVLNTWINSRLYRFRSASNCPDIRGEVNIHSAPKDILFF